MTKLCGAGKLEITSEDFFRTYYVVTGDKVIPFRLQAEIVDLAVPESSLEDRLYSRYIYVQPLNLGETTGLHNIEDVPPEVIFVGFWDKGTTEALKTHDAQTAMDWFIFSSIAKINGYYAFLDKELEEGLDGLDAQ